MEKSNVLDNQEFGHEVSHFIYRLPKKNHDKMVQLNRELSDMIKEYGVKHKTFVLKSYESPMEGIKNIAEVISPNQDEEVMMELLFYKDSNHRNEVDAKMRNDKRMGPLFQRSLELITSGTSFYMGEFSLVLP